MWKTLQAPVYVKRERDYIFDENCALIKLITEKGILIKEKVSFTSIPANLNINRVPFNT